MTTAPDSLRASRRCFLGSRWRPLVCGLLLPAASAFGGNYRNFDVAIYIPVQLVQRFENPDTLKTEWDAISSQLKVDKVYIEAQRDRTLHER